jgi:hypothetical protein
MSRVGFEPTIPAFERAKTVHALDRAATVIGFDLSSIRFFLLYIRIFGVIFCEVSGGNFAHPRSNSVSNRCIDLEVNLYFSLCKLAYVLNR